MIFEETDLKGSWVIKTKPSVDNRGSFRRLYNMEEFKEIDFKKNFVQVNQSTNNLKGTFRGMHYQLPPFSETKLVKCTCGKILDIIIDLRKGSETFLKSFTCELSPENNKMILLSEGFAHGYITLEDHSDLLYFHTSVYRPNFEGGLNYRDPKLKIDIPFEPVLISERDNNYDFIDTDFSGIEVGN